MRTVKRRVSIAVALAAVLFASACVDEAPTREVQPVKPVLQPNAGTGNIGLLLPYGSEDENNTELARSLENGVHLALKTIGNTGLSVKVYPTRGTAQGAAEAAVAALGDDVEAIIGPLYGDFAPEVGRIAATEGVPVFSFSNNSGVAGNNVYLLGHTHRNSASRILAYAASQGKSKAIVVHADNAVGLVSLAAVQDAALQTGIQIVGTVPHGFSQKGVVDAVPFIAATVENSEADILVLTGNTAGALPMLAQLIPEAGVDSGEVQFVGLTRWDIPPGNLRNSGLQNGWFPLPDPNLAASFAYRFQYEFDEPPHPLSGLAYDGIIAISQLLAKGGPLDAATIANAEGFFGSDGRFRFKEDGTIERGLAVAQVQEFQKFIIDPAPRSFDSQQPSS